MTTHRWVKNSQGEYVPEAFPGKEVVTARPLGITTDIRKSGIYHAFMKKSIPELEKSVEHWTKLQSADLTGFDEVTKIALKADYDFKLSAAKLALQDKRASQEETMMIIPYSKELDVRNIEAMPRGVGARYLEVIRGQGDEYVAKQWRRKPVENAILIDMRPGEVSKVAKESDRARKKDIADTKWFAKMALISRRDIAKIEKP